MKSKNVLKSLVKGLSLCFLVKAYFFTSPLHAVNNLSSCTREMVFNLSVEGNLMVEKSHVTFLTNQKSTQSQS